MQQPRYLLDRELAFDDSPLADAGGFCCLESIYEMCSIVAEILSAEVTLEAFISLAPDLLADEETHDALYALLGHLSSARRLASEWLEPEWLEPQDDTDKGLY